ncbi:MULTISPECIES: DUF1796 family putative cysteine peptidase [unclassified Leptolyngbya]|uniref:DUF1796 family putative cysteine peptidase n=1 Tax=unclassified Leptolyngbya TaxID=2650499 RepID=UPI0016887379|nr:MULTISPECIES: DUF1796 family putative cysteine peptidase [unclassified Leptolyngbya]MBD1913914.1 lipase [Leptolyngbya sp. FACHB-8]MBD2156366.1 lipase [Leptolyngbya sp. FACHB-16]
MFHFQISAQTKVGESIGLVGSIPELGEWDINRCVRLQTRAGQYPIWHADIEIGPQPALETAERQAIEYKYVRFGPDGRVNYEAWGWNRWLGLESITQAEGQTLIVDDGAFGFVQPYPFGYLENYTRPLPDKAPDGLKVVVLGSSVALGHKAWMMDGWASKLEQALHQEYGHQLVNLSELGADVSRTIARFPSVVTPERPDIVVIALSLGNEGFAFCPPGKRQAVQQHFEIGLQQLIKMTWEIGARPILGGVYPHGAYSPEHYRLLKETQQRMVSWGIPVLDWLEAVEDGQGRWKSGASYDPAHPNTYGHQLMFEAIALPFFQQNRDTWLQEQQQPEAVLIYRDEKGFQISARVLERKLRITNPSPYPYTIAPHWHNLQRELQSKAGLRPGIYWTEDATTGEPTCISVGEDGAIATTLEIPPESDQEYCPAFNFWLPDKTRLLFYDGQLGILQEDEHHIRIINESDHTFNIHPMWKQVRSALKALPQGVYSDPLNPDAPFRTLMVGNEGLESRVKAPAKSVLRLQYQCSLTDISRIALVPLGDRCAIRMVLYKMEYDGPAFPFDLTRTTQISDVADMIENKFEDMWNPDFLHYNFDAGRIYHGKWSGLSFAHEVEETDDPLQDIKPVYERMRTRYSARSKRFWYTLQHSDKILFMRTGRADRNGVIDLITKLEKHCNGKPFHLLLISPQSSEEFAGLTSVLHYNLEFNPDRMYEDMGHWMYCTGIMQGILESLGVSSKNLFWCPPTPPKTVA